MFNPKRLFGYLATGVMPEATALDESLAEHDKRFHPDGFDPEKETCDRRENDAKEDFGDDLSTASDKELEKRIAEEFERTKKEYEGTNGWMKAPNGNRTNLTKRQWVTVRTPTFRRWFGDWLSLEESKEESKTFQERLSRWMTEENIKKAQGKTREEIFQEFGNELEPIAYIPVGYLRFLDKSIGDNRVYSGFGYMIDHAVNHHPEVDVSAYLSMQDVINSADDVKLDDRNPGRNKSILFIKEVGGKGVVVVSFDEGENGKIVLHKSFFDKMKAGRFKKLPSIKLSSEDGNPSISHMAETTPAVRLSALEDNHIKPHFVFNVNGDDVSKMVDENGEPAVFYHGTRGDEFDEFKPGYRTGGKCVFFADKKRKDDLAGYYAQEDGRILECFLNIRNLEEATPGTKDDLTKRDCDGFVTRYDEDEEQRFFNYSKNKVETIRHRVGDIIEVGVFDPKNIKSATDNSGAFSTQSKKFKE